MVSIRHNIMYIVCLNNVKLISNELSFNYEHTSNSLIQTLIIIKTTTTINILFMGFLAVFRDKH